MRNRGQLAAEFWYPESKEHTPWCFLRNTLPNWIHIKYEHFENRYCATLNPVPTMQPCKARYIHWECFRHNSAISDLSAILAGKVGPMTWQSQSLDRQGDSTGLMCVLVTCWWHRTACETHWWECASDMCMVAILGFRWACCDWQIASRVTKHRYLR